MLQIRADVTSLIV